MTSLPGALLAINEIDGYVLSTFISQMFIDQILTQEEFNDLIEANPTYPDTVHLNNLRVLVLLSSWDQTETSHEPFDAVLFYARNGLVEVEKNKYGPPGQTYLLDRLNMWALLRAANSPYVATIPNSCEEDFHCCDACGNRSCCCDNYPFGRGKGINSINQRANDPSGVRSLNCDSEPFNRNFKSRKS